MSFFDLEFCTCLIARTITGPSFWHTRDLHRSNILVDKNLPIIGLGVEQGCSDSNWRLAGTSLSLPLPIAKLALGAGLDWFKSAVRIFLG